MPRRASIMSGTSKAIVSICVLLLASLVVYYGMTPPQTSIAEHNIAQKDRPSMFGGDPHEKLAKLGFPPISAEVATKTDVPSEQIKPLGTTVQETPLEAVQETTKVSQPEEEDTTEISELVKVEVKNTPLYVVKDGETLGEIASRELGSYRMWVDIANLNGITDPSRIMPGRTLRMPNPKKKTAQVDTPTTPLAKNQHLVVEGETMSSIASDYLGDANKFYIIANANPTVDPDRLRIGDILAIPTN